MAGKREWIPLLGLTAALLGPGGCAWKSGGLSPVASLTALPGKAAASSDEVPAAQLTQISLAMAENLEKTHNDAAAIVQYEKVLQAEPGNKIASRRLAVLYDRTCEYAKADAEYQKLAKARPRDADLFNDWGYSYYQRTKWQDAEKHLRKALELNPKHARARCNLGLVLGQQGRYDEALQQFRAIVSEAEAHCNLAFVYWTQGKTEEARRECQQANQIDPSCAKSLDILAALDQIGKPKEAAEKLTATAKRPGDRQRPSREQLEAEARLMLSRTNAATPTPGAATPTPAVPPAGGLPQPVYHSPNGTAWIPVTPKKSAEPAPPAAEGVSGSITWE